MGRVKSKDAVFTMKLEPELRDAFMAEAEASHRQASQVVRELMREFIDRQRPAREYNYVLARKDRHGSCGNSTPRGATWVSLNIIAKKPKAVRARSRRRRSVRVRGRGSLPLYFERPHGLEHCSLTALGEGTARSTSEPPANRLHPSRGWADGLRRMTHPTSWLRYR